ncbi:MAG: ABC transporter permease [Rhizobiaceae bacterium]
MFQKRVQLFSQLARREIVGRYRGTILGLFWSLVTPMFMLAIYTFVFAGVLKARWILPSGEESAIGYSLVIFSGLIVFQLFAEVVLRAPGLMVANQNFVKRIVFPLDVLVPVSIGVAAFQALISFAVLAVFLLAYTGKVPMTFLLVPLICVPLLMILAGIGWFLASLGTYVRDISHVLGPLVTACQFMSPIFYPSSVLPPWVSKLIFLNPITVPVEQVRKVAVYGDLPDMAQLGVYTIVAVLVMVCGLYWFERTRKGFADVL